MPKRELHRFNVQVPFRSRKRRGRKLVIRLERDTQASTAPENGQGKQELRRESARGPTASSLIVVPRRRRRGRFWRWWLLWLSILSILGVTVTSGVLFLTQLPPPIDCRKISALSVDGDRLFCAQRAAESGKLEQLIAALAVVEHWPPNHPLYSEAQRMMGQWSKMILALAQQKINQGDRLGAVTIIKNIPASSPLYAKAQAEVANWQAEWQQGEKITSQFKQALVTQKWQQADQLVAELLKIKRDYWSVTRFDVLMKQLTAEKEAWEQLDQARELAKSNTLGQLEEAIALATKVNPSSYAKAQARVEVSRWSRSLLGIAAAYFDKQDFANAKSILEQIPVSTAEYSEAQDWIRLTRAGATAKKDNVLSLVDALAAVRQIAPQSPVRAKAIQQGALWEQELNDQVRLLAAKAIANFEQQTGLHYATDQAALVAPGRPQRIQAQTLIAQWRQDIQQIEDRNQLRKARALALGGAREALNSAVAMASEIKQGAPLRIEAQTEIAKWNKEIQVLEDRPILDLAEALAQRQDWISAISTAGQIRSDRVLYPEAQKEIAGWVAQVQIVQDRPILEAATALAQQGRFDAAIATASQIPPDRALYQEAQNAIAHWTQQKATTNGEAPTATLEPN
ncbi:MAG TPA: hypothetical protein V6C85_29725 [Allocoleopsis sp.]